MKFKNLPLLPIIIVVLVFLFFSACVKNPWHEYTGSAVLLQGEWKVREVKGIDVTSNDMFIAIQSATEYQMYDGCNTGDGTYSTGSRNSITFNYPALTYKTCKVYETLEPGAYITMARKYSVTKTGLTLYDNKGKAVLKAEKQ
ncbi:MAG: hypothetical protein BGN92_13610 [Sphingobacteriales bacterium 41-5]|nr:MAG: hypothetical protein BGN92_13610 [Sphingobacteriales bacterium 41-5]